MEYILTCLTGNPSTISIPILFVWDSVYLHISIDSSYTECSSLKPCFLTREWGSLKFSFATLIGFNLIMKQTSK